MAKSTCPICDSDASEPYRPFCSKRCADVDLNRWLTGSYAIPVEEDDSEGMDYLTSLPRRTVTVASRFA